MLLALLPTAAVVRKRAQRNLELHSPLLGCSHKLMPTLRIPVGISLFSDIYQSWEHESACQCVRPVPDDFIYRVYICKHTGLSGAFGIRFCLFINTYTHMCIHARVLVCGCVFVYYVLYGTVRGNCDSTFQVTRSLAAQVIYFLNDYTTYSTKTLQSPGMSPKMTKPTDEPLKKWNWCGFPNQ